MQYVSKSLEENTKYIAIIEEYDDGTCSYGYYDGFADLLLKTVGKSEEVKQMPQYDPAK